MYVNVLGATKACLSPEQRFEASRLCHCKEHGTPEGPIHGLGATDAYQSIDLSKSGPARGCEMVSQVSLPKDFDFSDPCAEVGRPLCRNMLSRPKETASAPPAESDDDEADKMARALKSQSLVVFGLVGVVLVGASLLVYREVRS